MDVVNQHPLWVSQLVCSSFNKLTQFASFIHLINLCYLIVMLIKPFSSIANCRALASESSYSSLNTSGILLEVHLYLEYTHTPF